MALRRTTGYPARTPWAVELSKPIIAYRETIRKKVSVEGKHKKQSGGHGQYGHVKMEFEPLFTAAMPLKKQG